MLQRGFEMLRLATKEEQAKLPIFSTWGYMVIRNLAEKNFVRK